MLAHTNRHVDLLAETLKGPSGLRGDVMHDLHTVVLMRDLGIGRIVTRDLDFHRFSDIEVVDPLE